MSTPAVPLTVGSVPASAAAWSDLVLSKGGGVQNGAVTRPVRDALDALAAAFQRVEDAKAAAANLNQRAELDRGYRLKQQMNLLNTAYDMATATVPALRSAIASTRDKLQAAIMPKAPSGPAGDGAMAALAADQLIKLLDLAGSESALIQKAADVLADALRTGDQATAWVVSASPALQMFYRRKSVSPTALFQAFSTVMAQTQPDGAEPTGIALLPLLQGGPLLGFVDAANIALINDRSQLMAYMSQISTDYAPLPGAPR